MESCRQYRMNSQQYCSLGNIHILLDGSADNGLITLSVGRGQRWSLNWARQESGYGSLFHGVATQSHQFEYQYTLVTHYPARACGKGLSSRFCPSVSQSVSPVKNVEISTFTRLNNCCMCHFDTVNHLDTVRRDRAYADSKRVFAFTSLLVTRIAKGVD